MLIYFDLETTSLNPYTGEVIQIGALAENQLSFQRFIKPTQEVTNWQYHGVTPEDLKTAASWTEVGPAFLTWLKQFTAIKLIAHNGTRFDYVFLQRFVTLPSEIQLYDSLTLFKQVGGFKKYTLLELHKQLCGGEKKQLHTALADCEMLRDTIKASTVIYSQLISE